ncbi:MAG TPA: TonB-dependent receptor [Sphingobacteriaceae bacterium]
MAIKERSDKMIVRLLTSGITAVLLQLISFSVSAQLSAQDIKSLTVEELMNIEVISVSKMPEKLTGVASAIQVITNQDIQRSAATNVPEALRLASNLQVTQVNARHWAISSRGFTSTFSNKLLVMIDGRTVYSPLFAGVFWDAQQVMLEDVERIEVISGPGGTLWGANAVNGIINIITKSSKETQGIYAAVATGSNLQRLAEARYGGKAGKDITYRLYANYNRRNHTILTDGNDNTDNWDIGQTGFMLDWDASEKSSVNVQGNFYMGKEYKSTTTPTIDGQNIMAKWVHRSSATSGFTLQAYIDRTWRTTIPINDELYTSDLDFQHNSQIGKNHHLIWGVGYRHLNSKTQNNTRRVGFLPNHRKMQLFSGFVQDEIAIIPEKLSVNIGTKLQHNEFTDFEVQPSVRLSYTPLKHHFIWAAASRAVRMPSRIDVDYFSPPFPVPPTTPSITGGPDFNSEKLIAGELGYRTQPLSGLTVSLAGFYNVYDDLYSIEPIPGTRTSQIRNGVEGTTYGFEFSGNYVVSSYWNLRAGYKWFDKELQNKPGNVANPAALGILGTDANNMALLQSALNLPANMQFDVVMRYMDELPATLSNKRVPSYVTMDSRIAWKYKKGLELSINGQNLFDKRHLEIGNGAEIPRGVYGKLVWRY